MRTRRERLVWPGALLCAPALLLAACGGREPAQRTAEEVTVEAPLAAAERVDVPEVIELFGSVEAERTADVSTRVMATVTALRVRAGEAVSRGQVLLDIDPAAAQGQVAQARGALAQAQATLALARRNHERFTGLAAADAASELEVDTARMAYEVAQGAVEQAEGAVAAASSVAADSQVVAPFAGRVARTLVEAGDLAAPGRPLVTVESAARRRLTVSVPESAVARAGLALGDRLPVRIDARPDLGTVEGTVVEMTPGADPASHAFEVKVELPADGVPSGAAGRARVEVARRTVVAVPAAAVLHRGGISLVVVRGPGGRAGSRAVTVGEGLADGRLEILSGLAGGEQVLLGLAAVPPAGAQVIETAEPGP